MLVNINENTISLNKDGYGINRDLEAKTQITQTKVFRASLGFDWYCLISFAIYSL